jgi:uncharacterized membrane protein (UPF0127 family)
MRTQFRIFLSWLALFLVLSAGAMAADGAGPPLKVETASGVREFKVELARTPSEQAMGLMYRRHLAPNAGMLFVYPTGTRVTMWMKNTLIPLDMLFIGGDDRITHIVERTVPKSTELIGSDGPVQAVLELNAGTVSRLGIKVGDHVEHPALH